ncbi:hypothetical protein [Lysinibacillus fusiformis]|uniref:hypothetical protein n=1 Tax=Lysinibacillus fusiformis TaxID=28031 RepID=UPI000D33651A|nr:hypothetical protein [Lysinibacillus fusiformis]MED4672377.1 hypothetical protein [Lysinibacillus fusiformis]RDV32228.1 hypothetical protein C7B90_10915 [Lysinibacillus fusiformis]GED65582.1 hypothetical protein LFU01_40340 [Lysinibacillus fusiformis]
MSKEIKKIRKFHKGKISINELNAIQTSYSDKLSFKHFLTYLGIPAAIFAVFTHIIFFNYFLTLATMCFGLLYGLLKHLPNMVKKNHYHKSYIERNRFINNCTNLIGNEHVSFLSILEKLIPRLNGELYNDITVLLAKLTSANKELAEKAFDEIVKKYEEDVIFGQFFEQLETAHLEGRPNIETFKELKEQHNAFILQQDEFQVEKGTFITTVMVTAFLVLIIIGLLVFSYSIEIYLDAYAYTTIGMIFNSLFLVLIYLFFNRTMNFLYDDSLTTF